MREVGECAEGTLYGGFVRLGVVELCFFNLVYMLGGECLGDLYSEVNLDDFIKSASFDPWMHS